MTYPGGLTPTGMQPETAAEVQASIERDELALIDSAISLNPTQPLGQLNGIFASAMGNLWAQMQAVYNGLDPATAVGVQLDNVAALTGVTRLGATPTIVSTTCVFGIGQSYAAGQLVANLAGSPQYTFTNVSPIASTPGGAQTVVFQCTQLGPVLVAPGALSVITTAVGGWTSITNALAGNTGTNIETDAALRARRVSLIVSGGGGTVDSTRSSLLAVSGVQSAFAIENNTDNYDSLGTPPHALQIVLWDGITPAASDAAIAQAIWNSKPAGINTVGRSSAQAVDLMGKKQTVFWTRVAALPIYFAITVRVLDVAAFNAAGGPAQVSAAIQNVMGQLQPGGVFQNGAFVSNARLFVSQFFAAPFSVPGVVAVNGITMDTASPPLVSFDINPSLTQFPIFAGCTVTATTLIT